MTKGMDEEETNQRRAAYGNDGIPFEGSVASSLGQARKASGDKMDGGFIVLDDVRKDPAALISDINFEVSDYLIENGDINSDSKFASLSLEAKDDFHLKAECFYIMKYEQVKGMIILKKDTLIF
jgi:hypothetical protein